MNRYLILFCLMLFCPADAEPVGVNPSAVAIGVGLFGDEANLCSYPLALAHGKVGGCHAEISSVGAIGEGAAAVGDRSAYV